MAGVSVAVELVLGMIIALLINRSFRGRGVVRASVLVPWALTTVVSAKMWAWIYDGRYGVANDLLMRLGLIDGPIIFLVRPDITIWAMTAAEIWKTTPFMALLLLAGLQLIPGELYEAAALDGASRWQTFWRVTLPILKPTILVALLFRTIDAVRMFDLPRVLTNGGREVDRDGGALHLQHLLHQPELRLRLDPGGDDLPDRHVHQLHLHQGAWCADAGGTAMTASARTMSTGTLPTAARAVRGRGSTRGSASTPSSWRSSSSAWRRSGRSDLVQGTDDHLRGPDRYLPIPFDLVNYRQIFELDRFRWALLNSVIVASAATAISLLIGSLCAYAIARLDFPFKNFLLALVLAIAMFPGIAIIGPLFKQFNAWGLTNNYLALILPNVTFTLPICIWTLTAFFSDLPIELEESSASGWLHADAGVLQDRGAAGRAGRLHGGDPAVHPRLERVPVRAHVHEPAEPADGDGRHRAVRGRGHRLAVPMGPDHGRLDRDHAAAGHPGAGLPAPIVSGLTAGAVKG